VATKKNSLTLAILFHDDEKFLGSLLESILAQEDKSLSILALNNGSLIRLQRKCINTRKD